MLNKLTNAGIETHTHVKHTGWLKNIGAHKKAILLKIFAT